MENADSVRRISIYRVAMSVFGKLNMDDLFSPKSPVYAVCNPHFT